jgi:glycosyltransferase involved in cell wall biosynthesis
MEGQLPTPAALSHSNKVPLALILLVTFAVHTPLLVMGLPANSFDAHFHMSMAEHYAHHWFNPWNEKSLAGFSQTTYPPLVQQWIAVLSWIIGLTPAYMLVQLLILLLLPVAVYRYALLWVNERAASYAALGSVFLGSLCLLVYQDGQIGTVSSTTLFLLAIPFFHSWAVRGAVRDAVKALLIALTAASAHHATTLFGTILFVLPVVWLAYQDYRKLHPGRKPWPVLYRVTAFLVAGILATFLVLLPYFLALVKNPITQLPIPHQSRSNFLQEPIWGIHYWLIPMGAVVLALPYIFVRGTSDKRLRPLFFGFYVTLLFGLGGTTPVPQLILGRAFQILTFERFTFWALLMAMPFVGLLAVTLIDRYEKKAAVWLSIAAIATASLAVAWNVYFPLIAPPLNVGPVIDFLNRNGHNRFRYLMLGFGNAISEVAIHTSASSVDGEYNSARTLPEMTKYGSAQLTSAKYYGTAGIESLSAMLRHAPLYGLKYVFVHDSYYDPLLVFAGWKQIDSYNRGEITVWTTIGIPPAHEIPSLMKPPLWQGIMWGTLPMGVNLLAIFILFAWRPPRQQSSDWTRDQQTVAEQEGTHAPTAATGRRIKIALVTAFPPGRGDLNEYGYHLAKMLKADPRVDLTVLADVLEETLEEAEDFQVRRCWKFNCSSNGSRVIRTVQSVNPDVVWFNIGLSTMANRPMAALVNTALPALTRLLGYETHVTLHAFFENVDLSHAQVSLPALYRLGGRLATRILLCAHGVHVLLPSYRNALARKYGINPARIHVHSHGVFSSQIEAPAFEGRDFRVLAFGSWGTYKRLEHLLDAFALVRNEVPQAELVIAGSDHPKARGYIDSVKAQCKGDESIRFLGYVRETDIPALFRSAALAVLPYMSSAGSSGAAHLACEYGLPIVAADLPDFIEMAEWEGLAIAFCPCDRVKLAHAIARLLQSPELWMQMARQNAEAAAKITFNRVVAEYVDCFRQALSRSAYQPRGRHGMGQNPVREVQ